MPNYVNNTFYADKEVINALLNEKGEVDFNKIIPMPTSISEVESGSVVSMAILYVRTKRFTIEPSDDMLFDVDSRYRLSSIESLIEMSKKHLANATDEEKDAFYKMGEKYISNIQKYDFATWYDWSVNNWGTKWNAMETFINNEYVVEFDTAWSMPIGIYIELCKRFPTNNIYLYAFDEGGYEYIGRNNNGEFEYKEDEFKIGEDGEWISTLRDEFDDMVSELFISLK